jgi:hypothetical protein
MLYAIETKTMRFDHDIHALPQLDIMTPGQPRMITILAILATLVSEELITDGSNIVVTVAIFAIGAEYAKNLRSVSIGDKEGQVRSVRSRRA